MKKILNLFLIIMILLVSVVSQSWAGDASFFDQNIGKIIRAYGDGNGAFIEVKSTNNTIDSTFNINCGGNNANPLTISPIATNDVSLAYDPGTRKAYVFYQTNTSQFAICSINSNSNVTTYSLSGSVKTASGSPISGVIMTLNTATNTTQTGTDGNYSFSGLNNNSYTVTPSKANYTFNPESSTVQINGASVNNINFTGTEITVTGADLIPGRVGAPSGMRNGTYFDIIVDVKNIGTASVSTSFRVSAYISGSSTFSERLPAICSNTIAGLPAGQQIQITLKDCYFNNQPIHRYSTVFVFVDSDKQITETNETNNINKASMYIF